MSLENSLELREIFETFQTHYNDMVKDHTRNPPHHHREPPKEPKEVKKYFHPIEVAAKKANEQLVKTNSPYRFCIFKNDDGEVLFDIVKVDTNGKIVQEIIRNITHDDFIRWIDDISNIEGLFLDTSA